MSVNRPSVLLAVPTYNGQLHFDTALSLIAAVQRYGNVHVMPSASSLLPVSFNNAWAAAVKENFDIFAMIHADIGAETEWLNKLVAEMQATDADVVSAVIRIKDHRDVMSTAYWSGTDAVPLHIDQVGKLPSTFSIEDVREVVDPEAQALLVNTGCWVANLRKPWVKWRGFSILSEIAWEESGPIVQVCSEDWAMSREIIAIENPAKKVLATTKVQTWHYGTSVWVSPYHPDAAGREPSIS